MITTLLIFLLNTGNAYVQQADKEEVIFIREYREYGWKEYDADGAKLLRPIQNLVGFYLVEYRLDTTRLTITQLSASRPPVRTELSNVLPSKAQRRAAQKVLSNANPDIIQ